MKPYEAAIQAGWVIILAGPITHNLKYQYLAREMPKRGRLVMQAGE